MMAGVPAGIVLDKWVPISLRFWKNKRDKKNTKPASSKHSPVQSYEKKHQEKVWNMFKVNNKDTRTLVDLEHVFVYWVIFWKKRTITKFECLKYLSVNSTKNVHSLILSYR